MVTEIPEDNNMLQSTLMPMPIISMLHTYPWTTSQSFSQTETKKTWYS